MKVSYLSRGLSAGVLLAMAVVVAPARGAEADGLSLVTPQSIAVAEVSVNGRVLPLFSTRIGSRLAAHITVWGANAAGQPLDVGMAVKTGQELFTVNPTTIEIRVAGAEAAVATTEAVAPELEARLKDRERDEQRFARLVNVDKTVPVKRLEEVQLEVALLRQQLLAAPARVKEARAALSAAQLDLKDTVVRAPFDGVITQRMKGLGDYVSGAPLVEVLELTTVDRLEVELRLPEAFLGRVVPGTTTVALSSPLLKADLVLPIARVVPQIDREHGTFVARVAVPSERRDGLIAGAFVVGRLKLDAVQQELLLPLRAVLTDQAAAAVMVAVSGHMQRRPVELGSRLTEGVVIRSGLQPGERVVVGPPSLLKDGAPLPEALQTQP